jgi:hypothetical protein
MPNTLKKQKGYVATSLTNLFAKYPSLSNDYNLYYGAIVKEALQYLYERNPTSQTLTKVKEIAQKYFSYIPLEEDNDWNGIQKNISRRFTKSKNKPEYQKWITKLPALFEGCVSTARLTEFFDMEDIAIPSAVSVPQGDETYTIIVKKDSTDSTIFALNNISQSITMTSLSMITKAMC